MSKVFSDPANYPKSAPPNVTRQAGDKTSRAIAPNTSRDLMEPKVAPMRGDGLTIEDGEPPLMAFRLDRGDGAKFSAMGGNNRGLDGSKRPSLAHVSWEDRTPHPDARSRMRPVCNHAGNVLFQTLTSGASVLARVEDGKWSRDEQTQHALDTAFAQGWIPLEELTDGTMRPMGGCLLRLITRGLVAWIWDPDVRTWAPGQKGSKLCATDAKRCVHFEAERAARQAAHAARDLGSQARFQGEDPAMQIARGVAIALAERDRGRA